MRTSISVEHWWVFFVGSTLLFLFLVFMVLFRNKENRIYPFYVTKNKWFRTSKSYFMLWHLSSILLFCAACMLLFASMGISRIATQTVVSDEDKSILFVVDVSPSMAIQDIGNNTRLDEVKKQLKVLFKSEVGAYIGLLLFSDALSVHIPFSRDYTSMEYLVDEIQVGTLGYGTAISDALLYGDFLLAQTNSSSKQLVLISDGIQNSSNSSIEDIKNHNFGASVLLWKIGTVEDGFLKYVDAKTNKIIRGVVEAKESTLLEDFTEVLHDAGRRVSFSHIQNAEDLQTKSLQFVAQRSEDYTLKQMLVTQDLSDYFLWVFGICFALFLIVRIGIMRSVQ